MSQLLPLSETTEKNSWAIPIQISYIRTALTVTGSDQIRHKAALVVGF